MESAWVRADYWIETPRSVERAIEMIAGEQSSGTFVAVPGETPELKRRFGASVERIELLDATDTPSLPGSRPAPGHIGDLKYQRARFTLAFPLINMGANLPTLVATIAGNFYELCDHSGVRLMDVHLPPEFRARYPGPQFGVEGTRQLAGVYGRPIVGTIVKPSVGLSPAQTAALVKELAEAGIDFIKDDELMADPPHSPLSERVAAVMRVIHDHADRTGKRVMFAFNISDDLDRMLEHHDTVLNAGGTCIMASLNSCGYSAIAMLRRHSQLPIHGHRNGWGMYTRCPSLGIEFTAYQKLWRLAGVDHLHVNGLRNKYWEPDESVIRSIHACRAPLYGPEHVDPPCAVMPVLSSGQTAKQVWDTYRVAETTDLMFLAGGGVMAHPDGPAAGITALRQAWEAAIQGEPQEAAAARLPELRRALEKFA